MTRSVARRRAELEGEKLLVGLDGRGRLLDVQVQRHVRVVIEDVEDLGQRGHGELRLGGGPSPVRVRLGRQALGLVTPRREPVGVVERVHVLQCHGVDRTMPVGGPFDRAVVTDHEMTIRGGVDVELDAGDAELERTVQGEQRRGRRFPRPALVRIREYAPSEPGIGLGRGHAANGSLSSGMLDHILVDLITETRGALENALLQRQAVEERFQVDVFLGDVSWETSYSLPGEEKPPRVRADLSLDWPTWSQSAYRSWSIGEPPDDFPEVVLEITLRVQRLATMPDLHAVVACLPEESPAIGVDTLVRGRARRRTGARARRAAAVRGRDDLSRYVAFGRGGLERRLDAGRAGGRLGSLGGVGARPAGRSRARLPSPRRADQRREPLSRRRPPAPGAQSRPASAARWRRSA